jgi:hypothetical protein
VHNAELQARFTVDDTKTDARQAVDPTCRALAAARRGTNDTRLVGLNQNLEKDYLRLTTYPRPEQVRPLHILAQSLAHIKAEYVKNEDVHWANSQLKSVRQDMTVQNIYSSFVLDVYEVHARILLEHGDLNEFNQCQTMIRSLTQEGTAHGRDELGGDFARERLTQHKRLQQSCEAADEFRGYAVLYAMIRNSQLELKTQVSRAVLTTGSCCKHAMQVVRAIHDNDYRLFFRLYENAPHLAAYLMDFLVQQIRQEGLKRILAAYRPSVSVEHVRECLCFDDLEEARTFLKMHGVVFLEEKDGPAFWVDCKTSQPCM